jgi:Domain of unknown function (DUF4388)
MGYTLKTDKGRLHAMTKGRDNTAESLSDILELIRVRKQNGLLSVERFQGGRFEEGEMYFQAGQPTHARTGELAGQEALTYLLRWRQINFSFSIDAAQLPPVVSTPIDVQVRERVPVAVNASSLMSRSAKTPINGSVRVAPLPPFPLPSPALTQVPAPGHFDSPTAPLELAQVNAGGYGNPYMQRSLQNTSGTLNLAAIVPQKLGDERAVLSLPLTRPQRSIYMLVDGHRTIADLSRCMRKSLVEIERLLIELQERDLIAIQTYV